MRIASVAAVVGLAYAAISVYWGVGGKWLLDTVGGSLASGHQGAGPVAAVWAASVLKVIGAAVPLIACAGWGAQAWLPRLRTLAWAEGGVLVLYGLVFAAAGLLVQTGVVAPSRNADHRALRWHAYLWDPWFLVWGLLVLAAMSLDRRDAPD